MALPMGSLYLTVVPPPQFVNRGYLHFVPNMQMFQLGSIPPQFQFQQQQMQQQQSFSPAPAAAVATTSSTTQPCSPITLSLVAIIQVVLSSRGSNLIVCFMGICPMVLRPHACDWVEDRMCTMSWDEGTLDECKIDGCTCRVHHPCQGNWAASEHGKEGPMCTLFYTKHHIFYEPLLSSQ